MSAADGAPARLTGTALVAIAAASWGTWSVLLRPTGLPATVTAPIVFAMTGLAALPMALAAPRVRWDRATVGWLVANAACNSINVAAFFAAMSYTTVAIAVLTHYAAPVLVALAAPRIDGVVTRGAGRAAAVALAGLVIMLEPWRAPADGAVIGALLGLGSAVLYAANVFCVKRSAARLGPSRALSYHGLLGALIIAPLGFAGFGEVEASDLGLLAIGAASLGAATGVMFAIGLAKIGSARAAVLTFAEPVVAVVIGELVWNEPMSPFGILGGLMVIGAGIGVARAEHDDLHRNQPAERVGLT